MKNIYNIDEFLSGNLKGWKLYLFEQKMNESKKFRNKVNLYQKIDKPMKVLMMVEEAEQEMYAKGIDKLAHKLVENWYRNDKGKGNLKAYNNLFLS